MSFHINSAQLEDATTTYQLVALIQATFFNNTVLQKIALFLNTRMRSIFLFYSFFHAEYNVGFKNISSYF